ncbi:MAG TPA: putative glycoside hydrolase [Anaerolineales bacterium]|nr:putative glycoside hydrolase [Anaerolineales bacterium]
MMRSNRVFRLLTIMVQVGLTILLAMPARAAGREADLPPSIGVNSAVTRVQPAADSSSLGPQAYDSLAWFYKPPSDARLATLAHTYGTFILTKNDEAERDALRDQGVKSAILQYLRFEAIMDPGSCTAQPWRNQVADRIGDFCWISENHPDWFLLDQQGQRIYGSDGFVMMDPGNPEWRAFWLERARESQENLGWFGVFLDNVEASLEKREREGQLPARYPDDASYQAAVLEFLRFLHENYFGQNGRPLAANIIALRQEQTWFEYLAYLDGAMEEGWGVDWSDGYLSVEAWEAHLQRAERTQAQGKYAYLVSQGDQNNESRLAFAYASYLLVADGRSAFRYANDEFYDQSWLYPLYDLELGEALGPRYQAGAGWRRDFTKATVWVDPQAHTAMFTPVETPPAPPPPDSFAHASFVPLVSFGGGG